MGIDEIREKYLKEEGKEQGIKEAIRKLLIKGTDEEEIADLLDVTIEIVKDVREHIAKEK